MKFQCSCGARFAFDVDPQSPAVEFVCPQCGEDNSAAVNRQIREELGLPATVTAAVVESSPPLPRRVSDAPQICLKHGNQPATDRCRVCGKPICPDCMSLFGYVCSAYCRQKAADTGVALPIYEGQREQVAARDRTSSHRSWFIASGVILVLLAAWAWFYFVASKPRVSSSVKFSAAGLKGAARFTDAKHLLLWRDDTLSQYQTSGKKVWSAKQPNKSQSPRWLMAGSSLWVADERKLNRLRLSDGKLEQEFDAGGEITQLAGGWQQVVAEVKTLLGNQLIYRVEGSKAETKEIASSEDLNESGVLLSEGSVVHWTRQLLRSDELPQAPQKEINALEGEVTVGSSMQRASEVIREIQRQRSEEVTRVVHVYQMTLHWITGSAQTWTGEIVGEPQLQAFKSVIALTAWTNLLVFNHSGRLLWRQNLVYPVPQFDSFEERPLIADAERGPCREEDGVLYVWDKGMLSAFEVTSGQARWRLPQPNIQSITFDEAGMLYANSADVAQSVIGQASVVRPIITQIDPRMGKILWLARNLGHLAKATGRFLYSVEWSPGQDRVRPRPGVIPAHVRIYRLDRDQGRICWEHYDDREPVMIDFNRNAVLLLFKDEMQVLKFLSF